MFDVTRSKIWNSSNHSVQGFGCNSSYCAGDPSIWFASCHHACLVPKLFAGVRNTVVWRFQAKQHTPVAYEMCSPVVRQAAGQVAARLCACQFQVAPAYLSSGTSRHCSRDPVGIAIALLLMFPLHSIRNTYQSKLTTLQMYAVSADMAPNLILHGARTFLWHTLCCEFTLVATSA